MRRVALIVGVVGVGLFGGWSAALAQEASPTSLTAAEPAVDEARDLQRALANRGNSPDRVVVVYDADPGQSEAHPDRQRARQQAGGRLVRADNALGNDVVRVNGADANAVAQRLRGLPGVRDAYPDPIARIAVSNSDPREGEQWGLARVQAPAVWESTQGKNVKVAVLDCGVHSSHPDLIGRVVLEQNFTSAPNTDDGCNHGTHVAGTIAAVMNNGTGVVGVAPGASLLNGKVLDDSGNGFFSDIDRGIQWAADNGARVINLSVNADIPCPTGTQQAVDYAWSKGVVVVAATGNTSQPRAGAPANCTNAIGVAASDRNDAVVPWSNQGVDTDVAAPGTDILSTVNPDKNGGALYNILSGTSMASPHVAGEAALLWAAVPGTTASALRDLLLSTSIKGAGSTFGRVSVAAAVGGVRDIAIGMPTSASSTFIGTDAARAVDGNTNGDWAVGSLAHTNADPQAWWQVDLQTSQSIDRVDVWNRTDCCADRLSNFSVGVSDDGVTWARVPVAAQAGTPTSVKIGRSARYVRVQLAGTNYLGLAEVQVWPGGAAAGANAFASAPLVGVVSRLTGTTSGATTEAGEPTGACGGSGKTVWYRFVPQSNGTVTLDSTGSKFNTVLGVYTGSTVKSLTRVGCNDDAAGKNQAVLAVPVTAGQTYWVQLGGHANASGSFNLTLAEQ